MTWIGRGQEGDVPPEQEAPVQLGTVEVGPQVPLPVFKVEGMIGKRFSKAVHVCRSSWSDEGFQDPVQEEFLGGWAGSSGKVVARAGERGLRDQLFAVKEKVPELFVGVIRDVRRVILGEDRRGVCRGETERKTRIVSFICICLFVAGIWMKNVRTVRLWWRRRRGTPSPPGGGSSRP